MVLNAVGHTPVIDAQIHIWSSETLSHPWPTWGHEHDHRPGRPMTSMEALAQMDTAGVDRAILIPPSFEGDYNDAVIHAVRESPDRFAAMGRIDLSRPPSLGELIRDAPAGLLGVRLVFLNGGSDVWLDDGTADWVWPALEELDLPVMVFAPGRNAQLANVARQHPRLRIVIDHLGLRGDTDDRTLGSRVRDLLPLAVLPNIAVKASALPCFTTASYPFAPLTEPVLAVMDAFGAHRVFWGSDLTRLPCPYDEWRAFFSDALDISPSERELVLGVGLQEWLGWHGS